MRKAVGSIILFTLVIATSVPLEGQAHANKLTLVGSLPVSGAAGVSAFQKHAFVSGNVSGGGKVVVVDIGRPAQPVVVGETPLQPYAVIEETKPFRIGVREYLAVGLYDFGSWPPPDGQRGLKIFDITDPTHPVEVSYFPTPPGALAGMQISGVAHLEVTRHPSGRMLALLGAIGIENWSSGWGTGPGIGDLLIVDISDPANPVLLSEWGVLDEPALGLQFYRHEPRGERARLRADDPTVTGELSVSLRFLFQ